MDEIYPQSSEIYRGQFCFGFTSNVQPQIDHDVIANRFTPTTFIDSRFKLCFCFKEQNAKAIDFLLKRFDSDSSTLCLVFSALQISFWKNFVGHVTNAIYQLHLVIIVIVIIIYIENNI